MVLNVHRTVNTDGFKPNLETHLAPVLATQIKTELLGRSELAGQSEGGNGAMHSSKKAHHPLLLEVKHLSICRKAEEQPLTVDKYFTCNV